MANLSDPNNRSGNELLLELQRLIQVLREINEQNIISDPDFHILKSQIYSAIAQLNTELVQFVQTEGNAGVYSPQVDSELIRTIQECMRLLQDHDLHLCSIR